MKYHVFPRMCSLRRALLLWLLPLFLVVGAVGAVISYWSYARMVSTFMDDQMQQLASVVADNSAIQPMPQNAERVFKWGAYVVQTFEGGALKVTSWPDLKLGLQPRAGFHDVEGGGQSWRVYTLPAATPGGHAVQVVQSGSFRSTLAAERAGAAALPILLLLPLSMLALWGVARAMSAALRDIGRQTLQQDEHNIAELSLTNVPAEIAPLVHSFNALLRRLRDAFTTQRRFVQDAAHELRTPITAIGLQLENMRQDVNCVASASRFAQLEAGVKRAQRLVDQLLRLSRQEAAGADGPAIIDLQVQLRESINTLIGLADQRNIDLGLVGPARPAGPITLHCAQGDLRSLVDNLIENALRYTPEGGMVDVRVLQEEPGRVAVEVVDTGPGIPQELLPRVFDRFFRVPGNGANGSGLGLSIAQAAARRAGLLLTLRNREDRSGLIARIESV
ncbi:sensor histidine kinase [Ramlibacter alkalitolerans]|uniref:histidine kinase n=1 Tax=Ramlibacter alkalitolerans TaxID=2039631 RepID=A0ABS1JI37_9BURK|nr:ATP-binding protein [Ramlibacter alkalitolerans]MBL0423874.1 sensor histidine kinase N-terminal domain-containing protein [Ramlibacter alkalitolerans]